MGGRLFTQVGEPEAYGHYASTVALSASQIGALLASVAALASGFIVAAELTSVLIILGFQVGFLAAAGWRGLLLTASLAPTRGAPEITRLPRYTVLVALYDEAAVVAQLVERLSRLDYPADRLEGFVILEADDHETCAAFGRLSLPPWLQVLTAPVGVPRTKPRALNIGLAAATGELVTVYDAEDDPHPLQLREAAARFAADDAATLWALQAPLRVRLPPGTRSTFLDRQFAIEYASLFEVTLPGLARLGLPFPLGGTSNHFRAAALRSIGGWDSHNVTEDADMGFRLWRAGGRLEVLSRPTLEPPPGGLDDWLPQRTRWLKGFMQTWGVHTRDVRGLGWRGGISLTMTLGVALVSAALHAVSLAGLLAIILIALAAGVEPIAPPFAVGVLAIGALAAWVNAAIGCRRAGMDYTLIDVISAPAYWSLLSLAFVHATWRLITEPFTWDKTRHFADPPSSQAAGMAVTGREPA